MVPHVEPQVMLWNIQDHLDSLLAGKLGGSAGAAKPPTLKGETLVKDT
jgi:hypothetical protein